MSRIRFEIVPPVGSPAEPIHLVGNVAELGNWDPATGLALRWDPPYHVGEIEAETRTALEFKAVRGSWETEAVDAWGHVMENWRHAVWLDAHIRFTVPDWKDRYAGRLTRDRVWSRVLASPRDLNIWLPPSYATEPERRYPVLVMPDGRNVFDPATSQISGVDWAADERVHQLAAEGAIPETIVVGVVHPEGFGEGMTSLRDIDLSPERSGTGFAEFLATELVPYLDGHYRTAASAEGRTLAGASLGGLNAFHTALFHPGVFSRVACFSTAFEDCSQSPPETCGQLQALADRTAMPSDLRMTFDYGTRGLDAGYAAHHHKLGELLRAKGWQDGRDFRIHCVENASHDELSWREQLGDALRFLRAPEV